MSLDGALLPRADDRRAVDIRPLALDADFHACVALQRETWGEDFSEVSPASLLKITPRIGGITAGAFDARGTMVGFVFGMTGVERGRIVHWSHMLAVHPSHQNKGIGRQLKEYQRAAVARVGAEVIYWTFDPLVARNAQLNFTVLGVRAVEYVVDMYGTSLSRPHRGIGTDRLIVAWAVDGQALAARRQEIARLAHDGAGGDTIRIEIPTNIDEIQASDQQAARAWREGSRGQFRAALASGYAIQGFLLDRQTKRGYYVLAR